jgi:hypothetical protein
MEIRMKDWTREELKTYIGYLTSDLRGDWSCDYAERISYVMQAYEILIDSHEEFNDEVGQFMEDLKTTTEEYNEPYDGRVFRDCVSLYGYNSDEGFTERVFNELKQDCNNPEYIGG